MTWEDVIKLLDEAIEDLIECQGKLDLALRDLRYCIKEVKDGTLET